MTRLSRLCRAVGVGVAVTTATLAMTQVAHAQLPPPKIQPAQAAIQVPAGNVPYLVGKATGTQNYKCTAGTDPATGKPTFTWVTTPDATLATGGQEIKHDGGPTWTAVDDKSSVTRDKAKAILSAPSPDPANIAWLLIPVVANTSNPETSNDPGDLLTGTTFIQRVNTAGGLAPPAGECNVNTKDQQAAPVNYTADYYFYRAAGKPSTPGKPG
jgi:hypothetical protein